MPDKDATPEYPTYRIHIPVVISVKTTAPYRVAIDFFNEVVLNRTKDFSAATRAQEVPRTYGEIVWTGHRVDGSALNPYEVPADHPLPPTRHVGHIWMPFIVGLANLFEEYEKAIQPSSWSFTTRIAGDHLCELSPRIAADHLDDGSLRIEASAPYMTSGDEHHLSKEQLSSLGWRRVNAEGGKFSYSIDFKPGWNSLEVSERVVVALVGAMRVDQDSRFEFEKLEDREVVRQIPQMLGASRIKFA